MLNHHHSSIAIAQRIRVRVRTVHRLDRGKAHRAADIRARVAIRTAVAVDLRPMDRVRRADRVRLSAAEIHVRLVARTAAQDVRSIDNSAVSERCECAAL